MCLLSFHWQPNSQTPLTLVANRDEFHNRPAVAADFWQEYPHILAGKDLTAGGTWLGVTKHGFFAALTNVRKLPALSKGSRSRGHLVLDFLKQEADPNDYLTEIHAQSTTYDGFNLIVGDRTQCWYFSNRDGRPPRPLNPGLYGLSNAALDTSWPKLEAAKAQLSLWMETNKSEPLHGLLSNPDTYPIEQQPDTGIGQPWETLLSSAFIISAEYGTRASTGLQIHDTSVQFEEASYDQDGNITVLKSFDF